MSADELEDYLELRDRNVQKQIDMSRKDAEAGRTRSASELLAELKGKKERKPVRKRA